ncbi:MAG: hypothetical protein NUW24_13205 [Anaerolineae bacterium]|jgi:hypothetical protein|nr:hypothetical protein [Anaerolineae bacterium]MDH7474273.1 hypothetical protein [Anaerolineae bacterium]
MKKFVLPISLLLVLALLTMACNLSGLTGGGGEKPVATTAPSGEKPVATTAPSGEKPVATQAPTGEEPGEEEITYTPVEQLDWLNSYRTRVLFKWETLDEPKEESSMDMVSEYVKEPSARHFIINSTGTSESDTGTIEYIQIGNQVWMKMGTGEEAGWMQTSSEEEEAAFGEGLFDFAGENFVGELEGARRVLPDEEVNGVLCRHYTFDETMLMGAASWGELTKANGEVWLSAADGFTVKYTFNAEGQDLMGTTEDRPGRLTMEYEMYDINADIVIEPPAGVGLPEDIPLMADAKVDAVMGGLIMCSTTSSVEDVVAFYQAEMPANGWTENPDAAYSMEGVAGLEFTKEGRKASLMISYDEENKKTNIMITVE